MNNLKVTNAAEVEDVVRAAIASEQPLDIIGHGSKRQIGQLTTTNAVLDLSALPPGFIWGDARRELLPRARAEGVPPAPVALVTEPSREALRGLTPIPDERRAAAPHIGFSAPFVPTGV